MSIKISFSIFPSDQFWLLEIMKNSRVEGNSWVLCCWCRAEKTNQGSSPPSDNNITVTVNMSNWLLCLWVCNHLLVSPVTLLCLNQTTPPACLAVNNKLIGNIFPFLLNIKSVSGDYSCSHCRHATVNQKQRPDSRLWTLDSTNITSSPVLG